MGPASSGAATLMALATRCAANSVRPAGRRWLVIACGVARGLVVEQPRQEIAPTSSVGIDLNVLFMVSLPFCLKFLKVIFRFASGPGTESCPAHSFESYLPCSRRRLITITDRSR